MKIVTLSSKNQITLPKELLFYLGLEARGRLIIENGDQKLILKPLKTTIVDQTADSLTRYINSSRLKKSFKKILKETKKKTAYRLAKNL